MTKWQYKDVDYDSVHDYSHSINEEGQKGWEICAVESLDRGGKRVYFKRPIKPEELDNYSEIYKWSFLCPTRIVINANGDAVAPHIAAQRKDAKKIDIVFIRKDCWTLGAPQEFEKIAASTWVGEWMAVIYGGTLMTYRDYRKMREKDLQ